MNIEQNEDDVIAASALNIKFQFAYKHVQDLFNYVGPNTEDFRKDCSKLRTTLENLAQQVQLVKDKIPNPENK